MVNCKGCHSSKIVKNGFVRQKQRYRCKGCGYSFVEGDARKKEAVVVKKALAVILYSLGKSSFGFLGKLFGVSRSLTYRWIRDEARLLSEPDISNEIKEREKEILMFLMFYFHLRGGFNATYYFSFG